MVTVIKYFKQGLIIISVNSIDEWTLFYNGYDYSPSIVSFGQKDKYDIINKELQNKFESIFQFAKDKIENNGR